MPFQGARCRHFQHAPCDWIPKPLTCWRLAGWDAGLTIRIEKRLQPGRSNVQSNDEALMHELTNAGTQRRIPQAFAFATFGVKLKTPGANAAQ